MTHITKAALKPPNPRRSSRKRKTCCRVVSTLPLEHSSPSAVNRSSSTKSKEHVRCTNFFFSSIGFYLKHLFRKAKTERQDFRFFLFFCLVIFVCSSSLCLRFDNKNKNNKNNVLKKFGDSPLTVFIFFSSPMYFFKQTRSMSMETSTSTTSLLVSAICGHANDQVNFGVDQATQKGTSIQCAVARLENLLARWSSKSTVRGNG